MAKIRRVTKSGVPGFTSRSVSGFTGDKVSRDRVSIDGVKRVFARDPNKINRVIGTDKDVISVLKVQTAVAASLTTAHAGANNDLKFTAKPEGTVGNARRVAFVVAGASTPLTIGVSGNDITVNVATSAGSAATSTAAEVRAAVMASAPAMALLDKVELASGNDGTGVVAAQALTNLTGGLEAVTVPFATPNQVAIPNPKILRAGVIKRFAFSPFGGGVKGLRNRSANRNIKKF